MFGGKNNDDNVVLSIDWFRGKSSPKGLRFPVGSSLDRMLGMECIGEGAHFCHVKFTSGMC